MNSDVTADGDSRTAPVLERARALEAGGRVLDAIKLLHGENRAHPDLALEREMVRLRRVAFKRRSERPELDSTPLVPIARHPRVGLASVTPSELSAHKMRSAILGSGVLHVPGFLDGRQVQRMREVIDRAYAARRIIQQGRGGVGDLEWYDEVPGVGGDRSFLGDEALLASDSPRGLFELMDTFYEIGVDRLLTDFFAEPAGLSFEKCTLRRLNPSYSGSWHQDGAFLGTDIRALNMWITLSPCGRDAPGLELVPCRLDRVLPTGCFFDWDCSPEVIKTEVPGVATVVPELGIGDALFFDHLFMHRTYRTEKMTNPRYAIENWFFAPSAYPAKGNGLVV